MKTGEEVGSRLSGPAPRHRKRKSLNNIIKAHPIAGAQTLPFVRGAVHRSMMKVAHDISGPLDLDPSRHLGGAHGALLLPEANLLIVGTVVPRTLGRDLFAELGDRHGMDLLLVRFDRYRPSFDLRFHRQSEWLSNYRQCSEHGDIWFVPNDPFDHTAVLADRRGLSLHRSAWSSAMREAA